MFLELPEGPRNSLSILGVKRLQESAKPESVDVYLQHCSVSLQHVGIPLMQDVSHKRGLPRAHVFEQVQLQLETAVVDGLRQEQGRLLIVDLGLPPEHVLL